MKRAVERCTYRTPDRIVRVVVAWLRVRSDLMGLVAKYGNDR